MEYCNLYISAILLHFSHFSTNTGKYGPEKTPYLDTFHADQALKISYYHIYVIFRKYSEYFKVLKDFKIFGVSWFSFSTIEPLRKTENDGKLK